MLQDGEKIEDLIKLPPEAILLRWVNFHLARAQSNRKCTNFSSDIQDSEIYIHLLSEIAPEESGVCIKEAFYVSLISSEFALSIGVNYIRRIIYSCYILFCLGT